MAFADSFASGFNSGLGTGLTQYNTAQRLKLAEEQAAREAEAHAMRMEEARRAATQARRIEDARGALETAATQGMPTGAVPQLGEATTADTYFGRTGYGQGLPAVQEMAGDYQREMGRFGIPQQAAQYDTAGVGAREATDRDINRLTQQYALAANDINAYRGLRGEAADMDWKDAYVNAGKEFDKTINDADPETRNKLLEEYTRGDDVPGSFSWEPGEKGKVGAYWYMAPGSAPVKLSPDEARQLYQLRMVRDMDPFRTEQEIAKLKGGARDAALKMLQLQTQAVGVQNQAVNAAEDNARGERQLDLQEQGLGIQRARLALDRRGGGGSDRPDWITLFDENNQPVIVDRNRLPVDNRGVATIPAGLRAPKSPPVLNDMQKVAYAKALEEISTLPQEGLTAAATARVYQKYGLDPQMFGVSGLPSWGTGAPTQETPPPTVAPPRRGLFTAPTGETQLLQPLYDLNSIRRRLQEQTNQGM